MFNFLPHLVCLCTTWGKQNQRNIAFIPNAVLLLNLNNTKKTHFVNISTLWLTFHPIVFLTAYSKTAWNLGTLWAWRRFPHSLTAVSIVLLQNNPNFTSHFLNS